jgi:diaminopimelate decarboxylase
MNKETPHFIFKEKKLEEKYGEFERLCEKHVGDYVIAYSIKTNDFGALINKLHELGSNFEVASMEEIMKTPEKSKVFNGSCKTDEELQMAIDGRFLINVDSKSEIDRIVKLREVKEFNVSLRVSLDEGKFGFESNKLEGAIDYCFMNNLKVIGLSFHPGTQKNFRHYGDYVRQVEKVIENIKDKVELKYLDIGGGFPDKIQLKNLGVKLEDYFELIASLKKFNAKIVFEPGRFLVADAFELITKINVIKQKDGKNYAILDAGINLLSKITLGKYWFEKVQNSDSDNKPPHSDKQNENEYILAGPLLFGNDVVGRFKGNLKEGDLMKVTNVGAYCFNLAWEISYRKPRFFIE